MRHLLSLAELSSGDIQGIFKLSAQIKSRRAQYASALRGKTVAMIFQKPSTRTRVSFETGVFQMGGNEQAQRPRGQRSKQLGMAFEELAEIDGQLSRQQIQEHMGAAIRIQADRELVGEVADRLRVVGREGQAGQVVAREPVGEGEVRELVALGRQPRAIPIRQHGVEDHQPFDRARQ